MLRLLPAVIALLVSRVLAAENAVSMSDTFAAILSPANLITQGLQIVGSLLAALAVPMIIIAIAFTGMAWISRALAGKDPEPYHVEIAVPTHLQCGQFTETAASLELNEAQMQAMKESMGPAEFKEMGFKKKKTAQRDIDHHSIFDDIFESMLD